MSNVTATIKIVGPRENVMAQLGALIESQPDSCDLTLDLAATNGNGNGHKPRTTRSRTTRSRTTSTGSTRRNGRLLPGDDVMVIRSAPNYGITRGDRGTVVSVSGTKRVAVTVKWMDGTGESVAPRKALELVRTKSS